ncbi:MAG: lipopolysaccharide biosynthesis protein, partial [Bacteroidota bacterium]
MSLKQKAIHGLGWTFTNQVSVQVVRFGVSVLLARMLSPHDFGLVGMITVFIALGSAFIDGGMASSLIRTQEATHADFSTVFFMNVGVGVVAYVLLFFTAPLVASFFHQPELVAIVRVYAISFIVSALTIVQNTRLTKQLEFKKQFLVSLPSFVVSGVVGLVCAYSGMGVWSLVWMHLAQTSFSSAQLWLRSDWRPSFIFDSGRFKHHFSFGYKLTLSALLERLYQNITAILIGRYFSVSQLGFYSRAQSMKQLPVDSISAALNKVTYPLFASIQDDNPRLKSVYRRLMQQVLFWLTPSLVLASVLAEPIFRWLLTAKWLPAVPYFQIVCFLGVMYPIHAYNLNV